jgi:hypothetical protein
MRLNHQKKDRTAFYLEKALLVLNLARSEPWLDAQSPTLEIALHKHPRLSKGSDNPTVHGRILTPAHSCDSTVNGFHGQQLVQIAECRGTVPMEEFIVPESRFEKQNLFGNMRRMDFRDSRVLGKTSPESSAAAQGILEQWPMLEDLSAKYCWHRCLSRKRVGLCEHEEF